MQTFLIATDLDNTLLNSEHDLDPLTIDTFRMLERQGHHLAIASGRHFHDIAEIRRMLGVSAHIISTNGAHLYAPDDQVIFERHLPAGIVNALTSLEVPKDVRINLYTSHTWLIDADAPSLLEFHASTGFRYEVTDLQAYDGADVGKVLFIGAPATLAKIEHEVRARFAEHVHVTYSLPDSLEVMARGVDKGRALQALSERLGIEADRCIAFGDNLNDVEMLHFAGQAFIMANAHPDMPRQLPEAIQIGTNTEAGVARQLRDMFAL
ncbi:Cof-type HAD-IIB family hydrolase [Phytohalomonas tamaricis]|uniref:Cof-type HAD-IIB family hydrolase n=1 Tax=Phytohalomonas tamaricis TaxID=2081032 RepID=UPI000D0AF084|nr:Cof-type HAD-IIB family hydrolase [Phytohalomonas tamaricis]